ncbi:tRNA (adenosine(37)-N6)-threonylcarbamoyltransferase complex dimerization subunit type 1 TsaB, partial [Microbaculum marinum]|uniref:tRNA (adenosine(37)-N6)-threonylcarbamoyltransferase complex dimerization subunit type 1 TsaB n=1 Tax=Microbaculum marinum TaxID=1764581 RepID=UPI00361F3296
MTILAVDTALSACSVGILQDDRSTAVSEAMARGHAEALMPMLDRVLGEAGVSYGDIDRFAVTVGPGTFTGVRVGVAAVRGLSLVTGKPAIAVTTLEGLAETARARADALAGPLLVAVDARREEVYAQVFGAGGALSEPMVIGLESLLIRLPVEVDAVFGSAA